MTVAEPKSDPDSDNEVKRICGSASEAVVNEKEESEKNKTDKTKLILNTNLTCSSRAAGGGGWWDCGTCRYF